MACLRVSYRSLLNSPCPSACELHSNALHHLIAHPWLVIHLLHVWLCRDRRILEALCGSADLQSRAREFPTTCHMPPDSQHTAGLLSILY